MAQRQLVGLGAVLTIVSGACGVLGACGPASRPADEDTTGSEDEVRDDAPAPARTARDLAREGTFADLASAAREQDRLRDLDSSAGCILRRGASAYRLDADLSVAIRPLPAPEADLDARMSSDAPVRVLTRYGAYGSSSGMGLVALTTTAPPRDGEENAVGLVLVLTDRGAYARRTDAAFGAVTPRPVEELIGVLPFAEVSTTFVVAEAGISLDALYAALALLPSTLAGHVGLALALEAGIALPERPTLEEAASAPICDTLPESDEPWTTEDVDPSALIERVRGLQGRVAICLGTTTGPGARGGRMELMVRLTAGGSVADACIRADDTGDAHLRACVLRAARELSFPDPHGQVVFAVPLVLEPGITHRQQATCVD